jgi:leader peptidase (prepilin peptidase)/N-methyltransferase
MTITDAPMVWQLLVVATFGAVIGSFLNVCIYRIPHRASIVLPASACPHCRHELSWYENIPILSWIVLRGRCRSCRAWIGARYPIVEAITAALFAGAWWFYGPSILFASRIVFGCALIVLFAIDLEHKLLPNVITVPGIVVGFLFSFFTEPGWIDSLLGIAVGGGILLIVFYLWLWVRKIEALGMGDPKMLAMVGAFLGWKMTLLTLMLGSLIGSLVGAVLIVSKRGSLASQLPFGCFLALGAAVAATVGPGVLNWYLQSLVPQ